MKIVVLNGSPHPDGATSDMVKAFAKGAQEAGHEVVSINVAHRNIQKRKGRLRTKGKNSEREPAPAEACFLAKKDPA